MSLSSSTLVETIGSASANTYVTLSEFTTYCDQRLNADAFDGAEPDDKIRALLMAARRLERENWMGSKASSTQALVWPRSGVRKIDSVGVYCLTGDYLTTEIPQQVKDAQCELALAYLEDFDDGAEDEIDSFSADGVSVKFRASRPAGGLPAAAAQLLSGLILGAQLIRA